MKHNREPQSTSTPVLYFCHGGEHTKTIFAEADNPWLNQRVSLNEAPGQPPLPLTVEPQVGDFQVLEEDGASWKFKCPSDGNDTEFALRVQNEYAAPPYDIWVSLGDHRPKFSKTTAPNYPIVLNEDVAELVVTVASFYTGKVLGGVEVEWFVQGETIKKHTEADGRCKHTFTPNGVGEYDIHVRMWSPYDDAYVQHVFKVEVTPTSAWASDLEFSWNGKPFAIGEGILMPTPSTNHILRITPKNSNLIGSDINAYNLDNMGWFTATPPLRNPKTLTQSGIEWRINTATAFDTGRLEWRCSKPLKPRVMPIHAFSINLLHGGTMTLDGSIIVAEKYVDLHRDRIQVMKFTPKPGSSLIGRDLILTLPSGNDYGLVFSPGANSPVQLTEDGIEWSIDGRTARAGHLIISIKCVTPFVSANFNCNIMP